MYWSEIAVSSLSQRGTAFPEKRLPMFYMGDKPVWRSWYRFERDPLRAFLAQNPGMSWQYPDKTHIGLLTLDIDNKVLGKALDTARFVVEGLLKADLLTEDQLQVWFSGRKGFHIEMMDFYGFEPSMELPLVVKATLMRQWGKLIDPMPLSHPGGLIRLEWTPHQETGLYKIPLEASELFDLNALQVTELALKDNAARRFDLMEGSRCFSSLQGEPFLQHEIAKIEPRKRALSLPGESGVGEDPTKVVTCMQHLWHRGAREGHRHQDTLRLASWMWRGGMPQEVALSSLLDWVQAPDAQKEVRHVVRSVYESKRYFFSCKDPVMAAHCDKRCIFHPQKNYTVSIQSVEDMAEQFGRFRAKVKKNGVIDLADIMPDCPPYKILPGECVMLTGDTGMNKTTLVQNWVTRLGMRTIYLNLEMSPHLTFRRFLQIANNMTAEQVNALFDQGYDVSPYLVGIEHIAMLSVAPTIESVEQIAAQREPQILVVDTTDVIEVPGAGNNEMYQLKKVIEVLRLIAQRHDIVVIGIHHIKKSASESGVIDLNALAGNRANVTKMDHVFSIMGNRNSSYRELRTLKARDESGISVPFVIDFSTFRVHGSSQQPLEAGSPAWKASFGYGNDPLSHP